MTENDRRIRWTPELDAKLKELCKQNMHQNDIANTLSEISGRKLTANAVAGRAWRQGYSRSHTLHRVTHKKPYKAPEPPQSARAVSVGKAPAILGSFGSVEMDTCQWVSGEENGMQNATFCDKPTIPTTAWCREHHAIVYPKSKLNT